MRLIPLVTPSATILLAALLATPPAQAETLAAPPTVETTAARLTEAEARARILDIGYTQVTDLQADDRGAWHGSASRNGDPRAVTLDAQGELQDAREIAALTMFDHETGDLRTAEAPMALAAGIIQVSR